MRPIITLVDKTSLDDSKPNSASMHSQSLQLNNCKAIQNCTSKRPSERKLNLALKEEPAQNCQSWEDKLKKLPANQGFHIATS